MAKKSEVFTLTSPTHALALVAYLATAVHGILFLTDIASANGVEAIVGGRYLAFNAWAWGFVVTGALGFISAYTSRYFRRPNSVLRVELIAVIGVGLVNLLYEVSLQRQGFLSDNPGITGVGFLKGFTFAASTQLYALTLIVGAIFRSIQIGRELWKMRKVIHDQEVQNDISTGA
jgi:hypothetical protein